MIQDPFLWVGATIDGKYRVDEIVGEGGFGVVYRAYHLGLSEVIAVKCLKMPGTLRDEDRDQFLQNFMSEGRLLHRLSRANAGIVQALDVGAAVSPGGVWTPYVVLEWLDGRTLEDELAERQKQNLAAYSLNEAVALLAQAASALADAHEQGIAHRDVKPANLFLTTVGTRQMLKVLDFGIAKVLTETASVTRALEATGGSIRAFTPQYGAPEQFEQRYGATGPWTDVFALALILVELVTGTPALQGQDTIQLMVSAANPDHRPTPLSRGLKLPDPVESVIARALAVQPRERFLTARDFWNALTAALDTATSAATGLVGGAHTELAPVASYPATPSGTQAAPPPAFGTSEYVRGPSTTGAQVASIPRPPPPSRPRKSGVLPWLAVAGVIAVLVAVGGVTPLLVGLKPDEEERQAAVPSAAPPAASVSSAPPATKPVETKMVRIPPGSFQMGTDRASFVERPPHEVTISRGFELDSTEVTAGQYMQCVQAGKCTQPGHQAMTQGASPATAGASACTFHNAAQKDHPVNCVTRRQAQAYCEYVGKRLPTEAEWEYAARGVDARQYPWGKTPPTCGRGAFAESATGPCDRSKDGPVAVGSFTSGASPFGALDLAGNVREWVADGWDERAYARGKTTDPLVSTEATRYGVVRGGAWNSSSAELRATSREKLDRRSADSATGFRCARTRK